MVSGVSWDDVVVDIFIHSYPYLVLSLMVILIIELMRVGELIMHFKVLVLIIIMPILIFYLMCGRRQLDLF
jgi:hypothetical protein